jgi:hypothetical protein
MLTLSLTSLLFPSPVAQEHSLLLKASVGDKFIYEMSSVTKMGENEGRMTNRYEMTVIALEKGTATFRTQAKDGKFVMGGRETPIPESTVTVKMKLNGTVLDVQPKPGSPEQVRQQRIMQYVVPNIKMRAGSKWVWNDPALGANGKIACKGSGEVLEFAERSGVRCAKLHMTQKETSGEKPASGTYDVWLSLKDGMFIENSMKLENVPFGPGQAANMDVKARRVEK